jgi:hypothetical protein
MADVPDHPVVRRFENIVERDGEFDDAEPGAEMPAGDRHGVDQLGAELVGELMEILFRDLAQVSRDAHPVEERCPVGNPRRFCCIFAVRQIGAPSRATVDHKARRLPQKFCFFLE